MREPDLQSCREPAANRARWSSSARRLTRAYEATELCGCVGLRVCQTKLFWLKIVGCGMKQSTHSTESYAVQTAAVEGRDGEARPLMRLPAPLYPAASACPAARNDCSFIASSSGGRSARRFSYRSRSSMACRDRASCVCVFCGGGGRGGRFCSLVSDHTWGAPVDTRWSGEGVRGGGRRTFIGHTLYDEALFALLLWATLNN